MAASDAIPVPRKNAAFRLYFAIRKNDGTLITSWTGADSEESLDGGSFSDCTNEATEIGTSGCGYLDLTAAEMNADAVMVKITVTNTGALPLVFTLFPETAGDYRVDSSNSSVGSVSGAVGSVTGTVGSVTGNVGGNVTGSVGSVVGAVGSVTGAVGSVTGNVGGNVVGTVASVVTKTGYSLTAGTGLGNQTANITGNLSGSVGSVTGAVGSVTGNVGGNVNGSVASVAGNVSGSVGSVAGAVGSVTGSVGSVVGNVGGSVASVAGAVGSVTGNLGGDVSGKVLGGGVGTISGDGVRAASVTGAVGSVTGSVGSVVGVGAIADAVWDEARAGHTTAGTFGFYLDAAISGISGGAGSGATAQEVWEYATRELTGAVELDSATQTQIDNLENASGYLLAVLAGACADPQTASETYAITVFGSTFTVDLAGQTSTGTRTAPTLTKT